MMRMKNQKRGEPRRNKKGQTTIFIIIAIVLIAAVILIFILYPNIISPTIIDKTNPNVYIEKCVEDELSPILKKISENGGSLNPENYIKYKNNKVEYLCYTNQYYETCAIQQPLLNENIQKQVAGKLQPKAEKCVSEVVDNLEKDRYKVNSGKVDVSVEIIPDNVIVNIVAPLSVSKGGTTNTYNNFKIIKKNKLYSLVMISTSILNWEAKYGDADPNSYMTLYPNIQVEKFKQTEGSTIYVLTDRDTLDEFIFASRSVVFPAGYGFSEL